MNKPVVEVLPEVIEALQALVNRMRTTVQTSFIFQGYVDLLITDVGLSKLNGRRMVDLARGTAPKGPR